MVTGFASLDDAATRDRLVKLMAFADEYHNDPAVREKADTDPRALLAERNFNISSEVDVRIVANTADVFYLAMPPDPNFDLSDEQLTAVAGGKTAPPPSSIGTVPSCVSSMASNEG